MVSYFDTNQKTFGPVSYFGYRPFFSWKGVFTVNDHNKEQQLRYLEEVCIPLHRAGFETQPLDESQLPVHWNGAPLCRITGKGSVFYRREDVDTPLAEDALLRVEDPARHQAGSSSQGSGENKALEDRRDNTMPKCIDLLI